MKFYVKIQYMTDRHHAFERRVTINRPGAVRLLAKGEHGDKGTCEKCQERRRFFDEALAASQAPHTWNAEHELLILEGNATDIQSALEVLRKALPTAYSIEPIGT